LGGLAAGAAIVAAASCSTGDAADRDRRTTDVYVAVLGAVLDAEPTTIEEAIADALPPASSISGATASTSTSGSRSGTSAAGDGQAGKPEKPPKEGKKDLPLLFVSPLEEGRPFSLEVQAAVIERLAEQATVRFVDTQQQAVDAKLDDEPTLDGGVLLRLGRVPPEGDEFQVAAERYQRTDDWTAMVFVVRAEETGWLATLIDRQPRPPDD
jgi:hypothetical protein